MASTGSVISGSNAVQFLDRVYWPDSDLDLYVYREFAREVIEWITQKSGKQYVFKPYDTQPDDLQDAMADAEVGIRFKRQEPVHNPNNNLLFDRRATSVDTVDADDYRMNWISGVFTFIADESEDNPGLKVQVIVASCTPVQSILSFHSSESRAKAYFFSI